MAGERTLILQGKQPSDLPATLACDGRCLSNDRHTGSVSQRLASTGSCQSLSSCVPRRKGQLFHFSCAYLSPAPSQLSLWPGPPPHTSYWAPEDF